MRARYAVVDGSIAPDGRVLARDVGWGLALWETDGELISTTSVTGLYPTATAGVCTVPGGIRLDNNGDGVCNKADAHITGAKTFTTAADPTRTSRATVVPSPSTTSGATSAPSSTHASPGAWRTAGLGASHVLDPSDGLQRWAPCPGVAVPAALSQTPPQVQFATLQIAIQAQLPGADGLECLAALAKHHPKVKVAMPQSSTSRSLCTRLPSRASTRAIGPANHSNSSIQ